jgi:hypothetical protein
MVGRRTASQIARRRPHVLAADAFMSSPAPNELVSSFTHVPSAGFASSIPTRQGGVLKSSPFDDEAASTTIAGRIDAVDLEQFWRYPNRSW